MQIGYFFVIFLMILGAGFSASASASASEGRVCPVPWMSHSDNPKDCSVQEFTLTTWNGWTSWAGWSWNVRARIRSGYLPENPQVPFRGNVIYYQGLGDSMLNHGPLFTKLTQAGFRVIAFDYMGQGGSSGSMNDTRIEQIAALGNQIWNLHARDLENFPKKNIIGWSTGGLAAYVQAAHHGDVDHIVLIAPGIAPRLFVGEQDILRFKLNQITLSSLTSQRYGPGIVNPHLDPIKPRSPFQVIDFAWDLLMTAKTAQSTAMNSRVQGFVLLSGEEDTYVNARKTYAILKRNAPHFVVWQYANTLHEIDNEVEPVAANARHDILKFLSLNN